MADTPDSYEAAALRRRLNKEEKLEVIETFARIRDVAKVALKLNLPIRLVRQTLNNRVLVAYAKNLVASTMAVEFFGEGLDVALEIMRDDESRPADKLAALKFIDGVLARVGSDDAADERKTEAEPDEAPEEPESYDTVIAALSS